MSNFSAVFIIIRRVESQNVAIFIYRSCVCLYSSAWGQQVYFETSPGARCVQPNSLFVLPPCHVSVQQLLSRGTFFRVFVIIIVVHFIFKGFSSDLPCERHRPYDARCCLSHMYGRDLALLMLPVGQKKKINNV